MKGLRCLPLLAALALPGAALAADPPAFDLQGPELSITVTRGDATLPIGAVPDLDTGDRLTIGANLPADQRSRYLLVSAFLSGPVNPPPKDWIVEAETWKLKDKDRLLTLEVPKGARQMVLFLVPDTGGARGALAEAVRNRPGEFVRATQGLNQASLDRSRLNAFMGGIRAQDNTHPEYLRTIAPTLAKSLAVKLNEECLARVIEMQAACLLENRDTLVLADVHSSSMTESLVGAPSDLAMQLSYTREAGLGLYSPYIAVIRDVARVFGAFNNPQFGYLPTLSTREGPKVSLLLNTAPSFSKPKSVLVTAMPAIGPDARPRLRNAAPGPLCGARPDLVLPVEGAPLVFSTGYAHDMALRLTDLTGTTIEVPVTARADRGGYVLAKPLPQAAFAGEVTAQLHGRWGFDALEGPGFTLQFPTAGTWTSETSQLVVGRDDEVRLTGPAPACVSGVSLGGERAVPWKPDDKAIAATIPLKDAKPGEVTVEVRRYGAAPQTLTLKAFAQASRIDSVTWHTGDAAAELAGQRLDAVAAVEIGAVRLAPGEVVRDGDTDRLRVTAATPLADLGAAPIAKVRLKDGRVLQQAVTVAAPRPGGTIITRSLAPANSDGGLALTPAGDDLLPDRSRLTFSLKAAAGQRFAPADVVEVATVDEQHRATLAAGSDVRLASPDVLVATLDPARLGPSAAGPLRYRLVRGRTPGDWQPLARLVRLPRIDAVDCPAPGQPCALRGRDLFLLESVAATADFGGAVAVPTGYTGATLAVPAPVGAKLYVRLRDAPDASFALATR